MAQIGRGSCVRLSYQVEAGAAPQEQGGIDFGALAVNKNYAKKPLVLQADGQEPHILEVTDREVVHLFKACQKQTSWVNRGGWWNIFFGLPALFLGISRYFELRRTTEQILRAALADVCPQEHLDKLLKRSGGDNQLAKFLAVALTNNDACLSKEFAAQIVSNWANGRHLDEGIIAGHGYNQGVLKGLLPPPGAGKDSPGLRGLRSMIATLPELAPAPAVAAAVPPRAGAFVPPAPQPDPARLEAIFGRGHEPVVFPVIDEAALRALADDAHPADVALAARAMMDLARHYEGLGGAENLRRAAEYYIKAVTTESPEVLPAAWSGVRRLQFFLDGSVRCRRLTEARPPLVPFLEEHCGLHEEDFAGVDDEGYRRHARGQYMLSEVIVGIETVPLCRSSWRGSYLALGRLASAWSCRRDLVALSHLARVALFVPHDLLHDQEMSDLAKNAIRRFVYDLDPTFAIAHKNDIAALKNYLYDDAIQNEEVSAQDLLNVFGSGKKLQVAVARLGAGNRLSPRRELELKWALYKTQRYSDGISRELADQYERELRGAGHPGVDGSQRVALTSDNVSRLRPGEVAQLLVSPKVDHLGYPLTYCEFFLENSYSGHPYRSVATGEVAGVDPRIRAIVTYYYARDLALGLAGDPPNPREALRFYCQAAQAGYRPAAVGLRDLVELGVDGAADALVELRGVGVAADVLQQLAAEGNQQVIERLEELANPPAGAAGAAPDQRAIWILGMAREFGDEGVRNPDTAAAYYAQLGRGNPHLLGMAQAGYGGALYLLEREHRDEAFRGRLMADAFVHGAGEKAQGEVIAWVGRRVGDQ